MSHHLHDTFSLGSRQSLNSIDCVPARRKTFYDIYLLIIIYVWSFQKTEPYPIHSLIQKFQMPSRDEVSSSVGDLQSQLTKNKCCVWLHFNPKWQRWAPLSSWLITLSRCIFSRYGTDTRRISLGGQNDPSFFVPVVVLIIYIYICIYIYSLRLIRLTLSATRFAVISVCHGERKLYRPSSPQQLVC